MLRLLFGFVMMLTHLKLPNLLRFLLHTAFGQVESALIRFKNPTMDLFREYFQCRCFCIAFTVNTKYSLIFLNYQNKEKYLDLPQIFCTIVWIHPNSNHIHQSRNIYFPFFYISIKQSYCVVLVCYCALWYIKTRLW